MTPAPPPHAAPQHPGSDAQLYARSFADVYEDWYGELDDPAVMVQSFAYRCAAGARILELGSGTGRLATPLDDAGFQVIALDASPEMLAVAPAGPLAVAADMAVLPIGSNSMSGALIAYNTLLNLASHSQQQQCFAEIARVLCHGGLVAIEAFIADTGGASPFGVSLREHPTNPTARLAIITGPDDQNRDAIVGSHVELGSSVVCRPWRLFYQSPHELDACAEAVGLVLSERHSDWAGTTFDPDGHRHVSWYKRI